MWNKLLTLCQDLVPVVRSLPLAVRRWRRNTRTVGENAHRMGAAEGKGQAYGWNNDD